MKKTNRYILLAVVVLSLLLVVLVVHRKYRSFRTEMNTFSVADTSNVVKIFMSDKNNHTLLLERTGPYSWTVDGKYAGSQYNIGMLLQTMKDIEVRNPVSKSAYDNTIRQLAVNSVKVEIYQKVYRVRMFGLKWFPHVKLVKVYYVGGPTPDNRGSFALMEGSDEPYVIYLPSLRGFVTPRYMPIEKYWRDYTVFRTTLPAIRQVKVEIPAMPSESFILDNGKSTFRIVPLGGGPALAVVDTINVLNFLNGFRNLNFEALLNDIGPQKRESILALPPFMIISLTDTAGTTKRIVTFRKPATPGSVDVDGKPQPYDVDRLYALVNDGRDLVLIQYYTFDRILRPMSFFMKK